MRSLFPSRRRAPRRVPPGLTARPRLEALEDRLCPTIQFAFDYSLDATGFFNVAARRAALETAGQVLGAALNDSLAAIVPAGGNTWTAEVTDPSTGATVDLANLVIPGDTVVVYAGGRDYGGTTVGEGGPGGWNASGSSAWLNLVGARGQNGALSPVPADFGPWGGSVSFDTATDWNLDKRLAVGALARRRAGAGAELMTMYLVVHILGCDRGSVGEFWQSNRSRQLQQIFYER